jgi:hypothetical protein
MNVIANLTFGVATEKSGAAKYRIGNDKKFSPSL